MRKIGTQRGFTIVEIMSVIGILGVLAVITLPSIKSNAVRTKMAEAIYAFASCKAMVTELYLSGGDSPGAGNWGCEIAANASVYVDSVQTTDEGVIKVSLHGFNDLRIDFHTLTLAPLDNTGNLATGGGIPVARWRCGAGVDLTDVPAQFLPSTCRGG